MNPESTVSDRRSVGLLFEGLRRTLSPDSADGTAGVLPFPIAVGIILVGSGLFGFAVGSWRSLEQGFITAAKLPLVVLATAFGNAGLNYMLSAQLGFRITWSESWRHFLVVYVVASTCLAALTPIGFFLVWNLAPVDGHFREVAASYTCLQLGGVLMIAASGYAGLRRMFSRLRKAGGAVVAQRLFWWWLSTNFLLGSQLTWILRPFFGNPSLPEQFFRPHAVRGSFYESIYYTVINIFR